MYKQNISVIMATFNGSKYIEKQLNSILKQSVLAEEIIICDDNSTDETVSILKQYCGNKNIKLTVNDKQLGIVENFKQAAKFSEKGNWVVFADQDDIWVPEKLETLANEMQLMDDGVTPALLYSDLTVINKNDEVIHESFWSRQKIRPEKINLSTILYGNVVTGCTMMINYAMAEEFFCINDTGLLHDEWLALIAYSFGKVRFLREKLVLYRQHDDNVSFSVDYAEPVIIEQLKSGSDDTVNQKKFLSRQFDVAKIFLKNYKGRLPGKQIRAIEKFIKEEDKNYWLKRINRRIKFS